VILLRQRLWPPSARRRACGGAIPSGSPPQPKRSPAHRRIFILLVAGQIGHRLVAADIDGAEHHRLVAGGIEHALVQRLLAFAARQRGRHQELEFGAEQADAVGAGQGNRGGVVDQPGIHVERDLAAIL
jgi:hypothetical protein